MPHFVRQARRILSIVELEDGSAFAVEMTPPANGRIEWNLANFAGQGSTYLGDGDWDLKGEMIARLRAEGAVRTEYVADWTAWMADRADGRRSAPDQPKLTVNAPLGLESGGKWMSTPCDARIRPFPVGNDTEIACEDEMDHGAFHGGTLRDYAYPGSRTVMSWSEDDRRNFHGVWPGRCQLVAGCVLPVFHAGRCAP